jgi:hypothetical protein
MWMQADQINCMKILEILDFGLALASRHTDTNQISVGEDILITRYKDKYVINGFESLLINQELEYLWKLCTDTLAAGPDDIIKKFEAKAIKHQDALGNQKKR